jgi:hypothetical protein
MNPFLLALAVAFAIISATGHGTVPADVIMPGGIG